MFFDPSFSELHVKVHDLPHPDWQRVHAWERAEVEHKDAEDFWRRFVADWLSRLADTLGLGYDVRESVNFFLLSDGGESSDRDRLKVLERMRREMLAVFGERILPRGTVGKHVVMLFSNEADYSRYYARYAPDGETAITGGVCIFSGYVHIAIPRSEQIDAAFAHEFSHNLTFHLPLPPWLNEGIAMYIEQRIGGGATPHASELIETRSYWTPATIQEFWSGAAFRSVDGQKAAYALAAMLFRTILMDLRPTPEALQKFVLASDCHDAGTHACKRYLGESVENIAAILLGDADWSPKPESWPTAAAIEPRADEPEDLDGELDQNGFLWPKGMRPDS